MPAVQVVRADVCKDEVRAHEWNAPVSNPPFKPDIPHTLLLPSEWFTPESCIFAKCNVDEAKDVASVSNRFDPCPHFRIVD